MPKPVVLLLAIYLDLLGLCSFLVIKMDRFANFILIHVNLRKNIGHVEGNDGWNYRHLHGNAIDIFISKFYLESYSEITAGNWFIPAALAI